MEKLDVHDRSRLGMYRGMRRYVRSLTNSHASDTNHSTQATLDASCYITILGLKMLLISKSSA